jgi:hypothetical protein
MGTGPLQRTPDTSVDLAGYSVRALDGRIGTVLEATRNSEDLDLVVETGLLFKKKRVIPAAVVTGIDTETIHTSLTKSQLEYMPLHTGADARKESS